ncbi:MAG: DUF4866 family protein [Blautia faecis]
MRLYGRLSRRSSRQHPCSGLLRTGDRCKKENPEKPFDELGVLLPIHEFEKKMLQHMEEIDEDRPCLQGADDGTSWK